MWGKRTQTTSLWDSSQLTARLDAELDTLLSRLPDDVVGEIFYSVPRLRCLVTVAIRPDNAVLLPIRLRTSGGLIGRVWESEREFGGPIEMPAQRLHDSTSALVLPIRAHGLAAGRVLGIASFESSSRQQPLSLSFRAGVADGLERIADELARIPADALPDEESIARYLADKIEREVAFILDPHKLDEVYRQLRHATALLTSHPGTYASIILKREDAQLLGFVDAPKSPDEKERELVVPIPNKGDALDLPGPWDLLAEPSITRSVMEQGKLINIRDASEANLSGKRKQIAAEYNNGSELNVPIVDGKGPFGALILLSKEKDAFNERDERMATTMTRYIAMVTRRIEEFIEYEQLTQESDDQQTFKSQLDAAIQPLSMGREALVDIVGIRDRALKMIAHEAKVKTRSDMAAIILRQEMPQMLVAPETQADRDATSLIGATVEFELAWNEAFLESDLQMSSLARDLSKFRLRPGEGLVGTAFAREEAHNDVSGLGRDAYDVLNVPNVEQTGDLELEGKYVQAFEGVKSELVAVIRGRRAGSRGAIDLESTSATHFNKRDEQWARFLAREAVETLDAADLAARRWFLDRLYVFDQAMDKLGTQADLQAIQTKRQELMERLIDETRQLTGADYAQIYTLLNAYDEAGAFKINRETGKPSGVLGALVMSPKEDTKPEGFREHLDLAETSMAGHVVQMGHRDFFRDGERPPNRYLSNIINAESALVVPVGAGKRIVGVVNLESMNPRWCGDLQITLARHAAQLASFIQTNYMMRLESMQAKTLHEFGHATAHVERSDILTFLHTVLHTADTLSISAAPHRWARAALMYDGKLDFTSTSKFPQSEPPTYDDQSYDETIDPPRFYPAVAHMLDAQHPDFLRPVFIPNTAASSLDPDDLTTLPWPDAKALICVPLFVEEDDSDVGSESGRRAHHLKRTPIGFLTVASQLPYYLNDSDRDILARFADVVTHGLLDIAHLHARASLVREVRGRFGAIELPDETLMNDLRNNILKLGKGSDVGSYQAHHVAEEFQGIRDKLVVVGHLAHWYLVLSSASPHTSSARSSASQVREEPHTVSLHEVHDILHMPMDTYVRIQLGAQVRWTWTPRNANDFNVLVGTQLGDDKEVVQLICAMIYGCIERASALARSANNNGHDVNVDITRQDDGMVAISVNYFGDKISESRLSITPRYQAGDDAEQAAYELVERRLVEVRQLARALGGDLSVSARPHGERQEFVLTLPMTSPTTH